MLPHTLASWWHSAWPLFASREALQTSGQGVWIKTSKAEAALSSCTWSLWTQDTVVVCLCGSRILGPSWLPSYLYVICVTLSRVCCILTVRTARLKSSRRFLLYRFIVPMPVLNTIPQLWGHCLHVLLCHSRLLSKELRWRKTEPSSTIEDIYYTSLLY